jgi:multicomponent Na+:H+ antiporter subunit E
MIIRWLILTIIWVALWGEVSVVNIVTGLAAAILLSVFFPGSRSTKHRIRIIPAVSFFIYMLRSITVASWTVIVAVLLPNEKRRHVEIIRIKVESTSTLIRAVIANTISLTPGTLIIAIDPDTAVMDIHVLGLSNTPKFHEYIRRHEQRVAAFIVEKS